MIVFEGTQPSISRLMAKIKEKPTLWAQASALALRAALPVT
jgi:hypothetical protein